MSPSNATYHRIGRENATPEFIPAHGFFELDALDEFGQGFGKNFRSRASFLFDDGKDIFVVAFFADFETLGIYIILLGKAHASR